MFFKIFYSLVFLLSIGFAETLQKGDTITPFSLPDQFDKVHQVNSTDYKLLLVAFEKDVAVMLNEFLAKQPASFLSDHQALFISDIHEIPSFVTKLFALPKMRDYKYPLLLIYEEDNRFPKIEESLSVIKIQNDQISDIEFISDEKDIQKIFN